MNWNQDRSLALSRFCVISFAILLAAVDIAGLYLIDIFLKVMEPLANDIPQSGLVLTLYSSSLFAALLLVVLWRLLSNIRAGEVFTEDNVRNLRLASWSTFAIACIYLLSMLYFLPFGVISLAAAFVALVIRIVKNIFAQAIEMKSELDLTV